MPTTLFNGQKQPIHHTKFICGLGPASANPEVMEKLVKAGANIFRNNFAHVTYDEYRERMAIMKHLNEKYGTNVKMQADLQGTNIRMGALEPDGFTELEAGKSYVFVTNAKDETLKKGEMEIVDEYLHNDVKVGEPIAFADGDMEGVITEVKGNRITVKMNNGGILKKRKSINVPSTVLTCPAVTPKDQKDLEFLLKEGVDIVALSFIMSADEVGIARKQIGKQPVCLISKIERKMAVDNLFDIIRVSDGLMVARGDLGIELPMEEIPIIQKQMIRLCHQQKKPVITATQMLLSMITSSRPTRAEVSDVANSVFDRSDALMLSEETMVGKHPEHVLATMVKIARRVEDYIYGQPNYFDQYGI